jgi:hypothetical protein
MLGAKDNSGCGRGGDVKETEKVEEEEDEDEEGMGTGTDEEKEDDDDDNDEEGSKGTNDRIGTTLAEEEEAAEETAEDAGMQR